MKSACDAKRNTCKSIDSMSEELFRELTVKANMISGGKVRYKYITKSANRKVS